MYKKKFFLLKKVTYNNFFKAIVLKKKITYFIFEIYGLSFFDYIYIKGFFFKKNIYFFFKNYFFWFFFNLDLVFDLFSLIFYFFNIFFISKLNLKKYLKNLYNQNESFKIKLVSVLFSLKYLISYEYFLTLIKFLNSSDLNNIEIFFIFLIFIKKLIFTYFFYVNIKSSF
jgi:hypothetical protein